MNTTIIVLSWIATVLTSIQLVPQVYKVIKTKETKSIALIWLIINISACLLWIAWAILSGQWAILVTNILVISTALIVFSYKLFNIIKKQEKI